MSYFVLRNQVGDHIGCNQKAQFGICKKEYSYLFNTEKKAENVLNHLPKRMREMNFFVEKVEYDYSLHEKRYDSEINVPKASYIKTQKEYKNSYLDEVTEKILDCESFAKELDVLIKSYPNMLSKVDREISDVIHEIEFSEKVNLKQAYLFYKRLHSLTNKRREIKDAYTVLSNYMNFNFNEIKNNKFDEMLKHLNIRRYTLREPDAED